MKCARVLQALSHPQSAVIPVDLAMCLSLSQRQPFYQLLSMSPLKPTQHRSQPTDCPPRAGLPSPHHSSSSSSLSCSSLSSSPVPSERRSCFRRDSGGSGMNKKRVVFADAKGLALTAVRLFIPEPSSPTPTLVIRPLPVKLEGQQSVSNKMQRPKFRLGFPQPALDLKAFLGRLRDTNVQLESCKISEHSLSGKVRAFHVSAESAVHIRVTFDSWRSHHDIPCTLLQQQRCGGFNMDVFSFDLSLPQNIDPQERMEFCVSFRPSPAGTTAHWDDNRGQNYRVCMEKDEPNANQSSPNRFYPTLASYHSSLWPAHVSAGLKNSDVQHLQRNLSNRSRADWKMLCSVK
ncbi:protein phosphatase 1 regulatory subunit 3C-like [Acanthochromis polyacanthus]|uniref:Protein phosphatase 1 regulatory subunit 3C-like n=1 Tax=Acanthochromis polyacanthus TaxID=80966 RepID=A0A3Q1G7V9_9TELE|nr:protein phosphatase 1 regulatory subunit 3C-like [Acanthochromis polyacanthus]